MPVKRLRRLSLFFSCLFFFVAATAYVERRSTLSGFARDFLLHTSGDLTYREFISIRYQHIVYLHTTHTAVPFFERVVCCVVWCVCLASVVRSRP